MKPCLMTILYRLGLTIYSGLLTGCAGAGPHNSVKAAQSRTISQNPRNPAQYGKIWLEI